MIQLKEACQAALTLSESTLFCKAITDHMKTVFVFVFVFVFASCTGHMLLEDLNP